MPRRFMARLLLISTAVGKSVLALIMLAAASAGTAAPRDVVQAAVTRVLAIVQDAHAASFSDAGLAARPDAARTEIRRVSNDLFDFGEMSRRSLPRQWPKLSARERKEFVDLYTDLLARAYLGRIEGYTGERIAYVGETLEGTFAVVRSRITSRRNAETALDYRLHLVDGRWRVYDVLLDGVSLVSTYRNQFTHMMKVGSYAGLVEAMRKRQLALRPLDQHGDPH